MSLNNIAHILENQGYDLREIEEELDEVLYILQSLERDWDNLNEEEKYGSVCQAINELDKIV